MALPIPDEQGVHGFAEALALAHSTWQRVIRRAEKDLVTVQVSPPLEGMESVEICIEKRRRHGRPILVLEPHADDAALSAGGLLLATNRPVHIVTVFGRSRSMHWSLDDHNLDTESVTTARTREAAAAADLLGASHEVLNLSDLALSGDDRGWKHPPSDALLDAIADARKELQDAELIGPAAVTTHSDHIQLHRACRDSGCMWFWDDTSPYDSGYARSVDDRMLFDLRMGTAAETNVEDITGVLLGKVALLLAYPSQIRPEIDLHRAIRYNWTVAREANAGFLYGERTFHLD